MVAFSVGVFTIVSIFMMFYIPYRFWKWISVDNRELIILLLQFGIFASLGVLFIWCVGDFVIDLLTR